MTAVPRISVSLALQNVVVEVVEVVGSEVLKLACSTLAISLHDLGSDLGVLFDLPANWLELLHLLLLEALELSEKVHGGLLPGLGDLAHCLVVDGDGGGGGGTEKSKRGEFHLNLYFYNYLTLKLQFNKSFQIYKSHSIT